MTICRLILQIRAVGLSITYAKCVSVAYLSNTKGACAVLYCHLWCLCLYYIFPHYLINNKSFGENNYWEVIEHKFVFWFFYKFFYEIFFFLRGIQRGATVNVRRFSCEVPALFLPDLKEILFSLYIFENCSHVKFNENPSSWIREVPCGWTERQTDRQTDDKANSRF